MSTDVTLRRYYLPSESSMGGWAEIVIGSNGFFAAVSDYGNYSFAWRSFGPRDFRDFLLGINWHYLASKLGSDAELHAYDGEATADDLRKHICEERLACGRRHRERGWTREMMLTDSAGGYRYMTRPFARREWDLIEECDVDESKYGYYKFIQESRIECVYEVSLVTRVNGQLEHFCKVTFERFKELLRAELAAEAEAAKGAA